MTILFTSTYFYIYLSVKAIINFVITMEFKEFSTRQLLMTMFGFKTINCFIKKKNYIWSFKKLCNNSKKIYFTPAECDIFSLTSVTYLGFYFMILCCLNNYLLVFSLMLSLIKTKKKYLLYIYYFCHCAPYFVINGMSKPKFWLKIISVMSTLLYINQSHISIIYLQHMF